MLAHLVQSDIIWEDRPANYALIDGMLADHPPAPGDLVILPELFDTGFSFNLAKTADRDGATLAFLRGLARRRKIYLHGARTVIGPDGRGRNQAPVIAPDGTILALYDKIHPFTFGKEADYFTGGEQVCVFPWAAADQATIVCPSICYDLRFPELFRQGLLLGAEVFSLGANWPAPRAPHRKALGIARAIENQAVMLCVNRAGKDPTLEYAGGSFAVDPKGELLGELDDRPGILSVPIDLAALRAWRATFPAWRDAKLLRPR